ncbi:MAG: 50S ribosomal protein L10 [Rothia sp. (in: high G+C Gram-positive bacteria)]|nr:50S ribosomal protein L10 [Rothia sp. (in: high G+C Gram-positive bacteria)]
MATQEKIAAVSELKERFSASNAVILTEYRGLSVAKLKELRRALGAETEYAVVKNTLAGIAAKEAGIDAFENQLAGPSAIAFINGEMIDAAKALRDFAKENPQLVIKSGFYEGETLDEAGINKFANLESREVLLSKVAGGAKGALAKIARTVDALRIKLEESEGNPAEAPAEEAASEEAAE